ncbi:sensor histidine kinase [Campylobacter devanensis]|uniref:sensor histidine kinase n=1 Tax=Campylobacter devanensis TaxID=3161138 RepID=UPI000A33C73F|nr:HAMP domain-containing sensor histidine kinase [Campylobacter sp. P0088]
MYSKKYILPIFLLYTLSSMIFLIGFATMYYKEAKFDIIKRDKIRLEAFAKELEYILRLNNNIDNIMKLKSFYPINFYNIKTGKYIYKSFDTPKFKGKFYEGLDALYMRENIHAKRRTIELFVELKSEDTIKDINQLFWRVWLIAGAVFVLVGLIAFVLVKLAYLPLLAQIKALNNFITDTTHEINTPLSVILMSSEMFDKNPPKYLENIKIAAKTLSGIYNDLALNLKNNPNVISKFNIQTLLESRIKLFELSANSKGLKFEINSNSFELYSDIQKVGKILDNLISNAIKYSNKNSKIIINLDQNSFEIINFGATISKENIDKIYDKFSRFDTQNGGFGIGLSLVKRYCDELGLSIECESGDNQTKFRVILRDFKDR